MFRFILLDFASIFDEAPSITTFLSKTNNRFKVFIFLIALLDDRAEFLMSSCLLNLSTSYVVLAVFQIFLQFVTYDIPGFVQLLEACLG